MTMPKAKPIEIHTADSIAASLIEMTWAVLCTASRSNTSIAAIAPMRAAQAQMGTSKLAKSSVVVSAAAAWRREDRAAVNGSPFEIPGDPTAGSCLAVADDAGDHPEREDRARPEAEVPEHLVDVRRADGRSGLDADQDHRRE